MPGKTGKRARGPKPCAACARTIVGRFMRGKDGDYHEKCWWRKFHPDSVHAK